MVPVDDVAQKIAADGKGYERVLLLKGETYEPARTVVIAPTRGMIHHRTVTSWQNMIAPMNAQRAFLMCAGDEVGKAYNRMIENILADPSLSQWEYVMTVEDDNIVPADAHVRLIESIKGYDAVSGIYFTKGEINAPMAYGDPDEYARTGALSFRPRGADEVRDALMKGRTMPVCGIAMGCALWRMDLFRSIPGPWFVTVADVMPNGSAAAYTQDLYFCERAVRAGKRFAVDFSVRVGHLDVNTGELY
jgi:hypothetical protein